ncbi:MAG: hypothetical protein KC438_15010, partial [Thermomicrobiales bacterium]|nr:hypothetical protein [Thermomicrobiales bacterium]
AVKNAATKLELAGAEVSTVAMPDFLSDAADAHGNIMWPEILFLHRHWYPSKKELYSEFLRDRLEASQTISAQTYLSALDTRAHLQEQIGRTLADVDLLLLPVVPFPATPLEGAEDDSETGRDAEFFGLGWLNCPFDITGNPAISMPGGLTSDHLPIGIQLVGRPFEDLLVLDVAEALESQLGFRSQQDALLRMIADRHRQ